MFAKCTNVHRHISANEGELLFVFLSEKVSLRSRGRCDSFGHITHDMSQLQQLRCITRYMSSLQIQVHATNVTTACMGMSHSFHTAMYILEELLKDLQRLGSDRVFGKQIIHYLKTAVPG